MKRSIHLEWHLNEWRGFAFDRDMFDWGLKLGIVSLYWSHGLLSDRLAKMAADYDEIMRRFGIKDDGGDQK